MDKHFIVPVPASWGAEQVYQTRVVGKLHFSRELFFVTKPNLNWFCAKNIKRWSRARHRGPTSQIPFIR